MMLVKVKELSEDKESKRLGALKVEVDVPALTISAVNTELKELIDHLGDLVSYTLVSRTESGRLAKPHRITVIANIDIRYKDDFLMI